MHFTWHMWAIYFSAVLSGDLPVAETVSPMPIALPYTWSQRTIATLPRISGGKYLFHQAVRVGQGATVVLPDNLTSVQIIYANFNGL